MRVTSEAAGCRAWARAEGTSEARSTRPWAAANGLPPGRRVVVEVDGSQESAAALRRAASQARQRNATLEVVRVIPEIADDRAAVLARVMLAEFTRRACPDGIGAPTRLRVQRGDPGQALREAGADAELLVTAHPGPGGWRVPGPPAGRTDPTSAGGGTGRPGWVGALAGHRVRVRPHRVRPA